jgi:hypothetical protein
MAHSSWDTLYISAFPVEHYNFSLIRIVGGKSPNLVHSARRPKIGLFYLPTVIVWLENLVE